MDGFVQAIGSGISGLVEGSFSVFGQTMRGIAAALDRAVPGGLLPVVVFAVLAVTAWQLAKR